MKRTFCHLATVRAGNAVFPALTAIMTVIRACSKQVFQPVCPAIYRASPNGDTVFLGHKELVFLANLERFIPSVNMGKSTVHAPLA